MFPPNKSIKYYIGNDKNHKSFLLYILIFLISFVLPREDIYSCLIDVYKIVLKKNKKYVGKMIAKKLVLLVKYGVEKWCGYFVN